jgi:hypothetical protein
MTTRDRVRGLAAGAVAGLAGGLFGVGGGLLLVPLLTGFFSLSQHRAHGTSLAVIGATAVASLFVYGAHANVAWSTAAFVALGTLFGAPLGARWAVRIPPDALRRAFAVFVVLVALRLLWQAPVVGERLALSGPMFFAFCLGLGLVAGTLAGFMGVGGGIIVVPVFTLALGMTQQAAQGTSLAVMLVTAPAATIEHTRHGNVMWRLVPVLALGAAAAAPVAAWAAQRLPHETLVRVFAFFLLASAARTFMVKRSAPARAPESGRT